jgi:hypothetical protein
MLQHQRTFIMIIVSILWVIWLLSNYKITPDSFDNFILSPIGKIVGIGVVVIGCFTFSLPLAVIIFITAIKLYNTALYNRYLPSDEHRVQAIQSYNTIRNTRTLEEDMIELGTTMHQIV